MNNLGLLYHNVEFHFVVLELSGQGVYLSHEFLHFEINIVTFRVQLQLQFFSFTKPHQRNMELLCRSGGSLIINHIFQFYIFSLGHQPHMCEMMVDFFKLIQKGILTMMKSITFPQQIIQLKLELHLLSLQIKVFPSILVERDNHFLHSLIERSIIYHRGIHECLLGKRCANENA